MLNQENFMEERVSKVPVLKTSRALDNLLIISNGEGYTIDREKVCCTVLNPDDRIINEELNHINPQDPGQRLEMMFCAGFSAGFKKVVVVTAFFDGIESSIQEAFEELNKVQVVLGPTANGRFYLYGMTEFNRDLFYGKPWDSPFLNYQLLLDLSRKRLPFQLLNFMEMDGHIGAA